MNDDNIVCSLRNVSLTYSERTKLRRSETQVLSNVDIDIRRGETLGIIGRNGAGKSTLLKIVAGVIKPNAGTIKVDPSIRSALLTYQLGFNATLTGRENAVYGALLLGVDRETAESVLDEVFEFAGLEKYIDVPLSQYSAGMRARLGFSVALAVQPEMILIDEALGVGDHQFREKSGNAIREWIQTDKTVVFVSHDESSVRNLCDRVIWLEHGKPIFSGEADQVLDQYLAFDHFVSSLANNNPQWTEEYIRNHPLARNPLETLNKMRTELKSEWADYKRETAERFAGVVGVYLPLGDNRPCHIVKDEDGQTYWIEHTNIVMQGEDREVRQRFNLFQKTVSSIAARTNMTVDEFRSSSLYPSCLQLIGLADL